MNQPKRNRALFSVSASLLFLAKTRPGYIVEVASNDIPDDAKIVGTYYEPGTDTFVAVLESEHFPETADPSQQLPQVHGPFFLSRESDAGSTAPVKFREFL